MIVRALCALWPCGDLQPQHVIHWKLKNRCWYHPVEAYQRNLLWNFKRNGWLCIACNPILHTENVHSETEPIQLEHPLQVIRLTITHCIYLFFPLLSPIRNHSKYLHIIVALFSRSPFSYMPQSAKRIWITLALMIWFTHSCYHQH